MMGEAIVMSRVQIPQPRCRRYNNEPSPSPRDLQLNIYNKVTLYSFDKHGRRLCVAK